MKRIVGSALPFAPAGAGALRASGSGARLRSSLRATVADAVVPVVRSAATSSVPASRLHATSDTPDASAIATDITNARPSPCRADPPYILRLDMLEARSLTKEYPSGEQRLTVLRDVSFTIPDGARVAIVGPSGSGKTTLLGLLAGLDTPTSGKVLLDGNDLSAL